MNSGVRYTRPNGDVKTGINAPTDMIRGMTHDDNLLLGVPLDLETPTRESTAPNRDLLPNLRGLQGTSSRMQN